MADQKITELAELTTPVAVDLLVIVDDPSGSPADKKVTVENFIALGATPPNLLKNGNFINNSTNGYGKTPDDWNDSSANPVQGGVPTLTKAELISILGISDGDIEGLWPLNEASGNALDLSSNGYNLTETGGTIAADDDGLMATARDFEHNDEEYFLIANASCPNLEIAGSQTWFCWYKPESLEDTRLLNRNNNTKSLFFHTTGRVSMQIVGLTTESVESDIE